ncbi:MAG: hypothetical protein KDJ70_17090 [Candidatus Competibacteraceae bacterium]|nr:hypothetical protein [Candidatus Competibacteraceae bacterium]
MARANKPISLLTVLAAAPANDVLWELTFGMLGLAGLRSWEKSKGVARS